MSKRTPMWHVLNSCGLWILPYSQAKSNHCPQCQCQVMSMLKKPLVDFWKLSLRWSLREFQPKPPAKCTVFHRGILEVILSISVGLRLRQWRWPGSAKQL